MRMYAISFAEAKLIPLIFGMHIDFSQINDCDKMMLTEFI